MSASETEMLTHEDTFEKLKNGGEQELNIVFFT